MGWFEINKDEDNDMSSYSDMYSEEDVEEHARIQGSILFKNLMETSMIENYINDEMVKKRIWLLRKLPMTITHEDINYYMNEATDEKINQLAHLSRLTFDNNEKAKIKQDLERILELCESLKSLVMLL